PQNPLDAGGLAGAAAVGVEGRHWTGADLELATGERAADWADPLVPSGPPDLPDYWKGLPPAFPRVIARIRSRWIDDPAAVARVPSDRRHASTSSTPERTFRLRSRNRRSASAIIASAQAS